MTTIPDDEAVESMIRQNADASAGIRSIRAGSLYGELQDWWMDKARSEIEPMIRKMEEYGGNGRAMDLVDMGRKMHEAGVALPGSSVIAPGDSQDDQFIELAIYFYVMGKLGRWTAAINEGRAVADDTIDDAIVYLRMLQRTREVGGWPQ